MAAPIDPKQLLFQKELQEREPKQEIPTPEENAVPEDREPLLNKIPKIAEPAKKKIEEKPKPTQGELITKEVTGSYTRLINYLKQAEGTPRQQAQTGSFKGGRFRVYNDVGRQAIGYGHRLLPGEDKLFKGGITEEEATRILMQDIKKAELLAERHFGKKGWAAMDHHRREMAIDFMYNLGAGRKASKDKPATGFAAFITFSRALRQGDVKGIRAKYKRHYSPEPGQPKIPLKPRNDLFYKTFIMPLETGEIEIGQQRAKEPIRPSLR